MRGSANVVTEAREVRGFDAVRLSGSGILTIEQGGEESLTIEAEDNIMPLIETRIEGNRLNIGYRNGTADPRPTQPIRFYLGAKELRSIESSGSGQIRSACLSSERLDVRISGSGQVMLESVSVSRLELVISGSGRFTAGGEAGSQRVTISGSGSYDGAGVSCASAEVVVSGSGRVTLRVSDSLNVVITGSGVVEYAGNPRVSQVVSGSGGFRRRAEG
ncbi:MAG: DUF2807 domain-containing protein [Chloroflexota bacterium]|nr:DUF2807 domain-containing protein [Chloroflexota bacterium]